MIHIRLMKSTSPLPGPVKAALRKLGADIRDARRRRRIPTTLMAERAFISRATLGRLEKGDPSVSMGNYAAVLFVLGLTDSLRNLVDANNDPVGRTLEEERLPKRIHRPRSHEWYFDTWWRPCKILSVASYVRISSPFGPLMSTPPWYAEILSPPPPLISILLSCSST